MREQGQTQNALRWQMLPEKETGKGRKRTGTLSTQSKKRTGGQFILLNDAV